MSMDLVQTAANQYVYIVDDDDAVRDALGMLFESAGFAYVAYASAADFLDQLQPSFNGCLVLDIRMPEMSGLELQQKLKAEQCDLPIIFITGHGDMPMAVEAMRQGAIDFLRKPIDEQDLLLRIQSAFELHSGNREKRQSRRLVKDKIGSLTDREAQVFVLVTNGEANKVIASELSISERTVEVHRSQVMKKLDAKTLAQLVRMRIEMEPN